MTSIDRSSQSTCKKFKTEGLLQEVFSSHIWPKADYTADMYQGGLRIKSRRPQWKPYPTPPIGDDHSFVIWRLPTSLRERIRQTQKPNLETRP